MLVTLSRVEKEIPHEPGQRMTFRLLKGEEVDEAKRVATQRNLEASIPFMRLSEGIDLSKVPPPPPAEENPEDVRRKEHDADILIKYGVVDWSYQAECDEATKRDLDARTRDWARDIILDMNVRLEGEVGNSGASSPEGAFPPSSRKRTISASGA